MDIAVYESKRGMALLLAGLCVLIGVWAISVSAGDRDPVSTPIIGGLVAVYGTVHFLIDGVRPPRLRVTAEGLIIERPLKTPLPVAWSELDSFLVVRRRSLTLLAYRLRAGSTVAPLSAVSRLLEGVDGVLYGFWPKSPKLMAEILNHYRETLGGEQPVVVSPAAPMSKGPPPIPSAEPAAAVQPPPISEPFRLFRRKRPKDGAGGPPIVS